LFCGGSRPESKQAIKPAVVSEHPLFHAVHFQGDVHIYLFAYSAHVTVFAAAHATGQTVDGQLGFKPGYFFLLSKGKSLPPRKTKRTAIFW
jgi:hypothetical protein